MKWKSKLFLCSVLFLVLMTGKTQADTTEVVEEDIFKAIRNIDIVSLNVLLAQDAEIDSVDENGNTALMLASKIGNPRMIKIILAHNPTINMKNNMGYTALMIASEQGQVHIVEQLLRRGADPTLKNRDGLTASDLALRNGQPQTVNLLREVKKSSVTR